MIIIRRKCYIVILILLVTAIIVGNVFPASATSIDAPYDWCTKPSTNNEFPLLMDGIDFYNKYNVVCGEKTDEKVIYLTFDAGYDNGTHNVILDILKEEDVPATFFFDGNMLKTSGDIVKRAVSEGHIVANHTLNHPDMTLYKSNKTKYMYQLEEWNNIYTEITGLEPVKIMRFPMGRYSERCLQYNDEAGYCSVFWSFAYYDYDDSDQPLPSFAIQKIMSRVHSGAVMLLHSTSETNSIILDEVIKSLKAEGYRFGVITELII